MGYLVIYLKVFFKRLPCYLSKGTYSSKGCLVIYLKVFFKGLPCYLFKGIL